MGVDFPRTAVSSILKEHEEWEKEKQRKTSKSKLHKRLD